ncbi:malonyl-ACP O-methyltransferase BioC [Marinomonas sp. 2405UD68-3]|uniref:malonyl-ACP O-methyltransferase BioC n=1 Tax=Marinomonas sp. 2405UD68-3 TaxID=3391835 RepID=UPI0039C8C94A
MSSLFMPPDVDLTYKLQLARSFSRAASTYDFHANFQKQVLTSLLSMLPSVQLDRVMDLGCGTGNALKSLSYLSQQLIGVDLSESMLGIAYEKESGANVICADAENLPFTDNSFNLIFSSLSIQWCQSHLSLFNEIKRIMDSEGWWCFSTLCEGSMLEIGEAWKQVDGRLHSNQYPSVEKIVSDLLESGLEIHQKEVRTMKMHFHTVQDAIYSVKKVGASVVTEADNRSSVTPSMWRAFVTQYNAFHDGVGIPLSYQVAFIIARKKVR